jgi:protein gp37
MGRGTAEPARESEIATAGRNATLRTGETTEQKGRPTMGENSKIQWCNHTFNHVRGCTKVAEGCANCYAETLSRRNPSTLGIWGPNGTRVMAAPAAWREPVKWDKAAAAAGERHRVFCASLADVFEDWDGAIVDSRGRQLFVDGPTYFAPGKNYIAMSPAATLDDLRRDLFALIDATPHLDWLILTKRPDNIRRMWPAVAIGSQQQADDRNERGELYRRNVWLLTSIATQADADRNIPHLLQCRDLAPVMGVSHEPGLELVMPWPGVDWWIVGCESNGPRVGRLGARSEGQWREMAVGIVRYARGNSIAPFVKQVPMNGRVNHNMDEWPADLRVREFPTPAMAGRY